MTNDSTPWQDPVSFPQLLSGQLHLWKFSLEILPEHYQNQRSFLSTIELARADRLLDPQKQQAFTISRSCLRQLLAKYLGLSPESVEFNYNISGKPFIAAKNSKNLTFNLSHSGSMAVLAVTIDVDVGVDIEKIDSDLNFQLLASCYFTPAENVQLRGLSISRQRRQFYRIWTVKEAVLKMAGSGFSPTEPFAPLAQDCCCKNIFFAGNYVSAIATARRIFAIHKFKFSPEDKIG